MNRQNNRLMINKGREMRELINRWLASKIYKEYTLKKEKMSLNKTLTKTELDEICNSIIALYDLTPEQRDDFDFIEELSIETLSKTELFKQLTKTLSTWYMYLKKHVELEDYELCAKIRDVITIEKQEFYSILSKYSHEFNIKEDYNTITIIEHEIRKVFNL